MNIGIVQVSLNEAVPTSLQRITAGMIGATVDFVFDETWEKYQKTIVWKAGKVIKDDTTASGVVPAEVLAVAGAVLHVGVYGVADGVATPTVWACLGAVLSGANPSGDDSTDPSLPVWAQLAEAIERLEAGGGGTGGYVVVDDKLSATSKNPVQNKVITGEFNKALADIENQFADVYAAIPPAITVDDEMSYESTNPVQNRVVMQAISAIGPVAGNAESMAKEAIRQAQQALSSTADANGRIDTLEAAVGDIDTALDELHTYAQSLVGGAGE
jgi:hypothetical protein